MFSHESEILRKLRLIEGLKADLIVNTGQLYQAMAKNSEQAIKDGLASVIISCYVLGRRLGISFAELDESIDVHLQHTIKRENEVEKWFGDFSECQRHLRQKR